MNRMMATIVSRVLDPMVTLSLLSVAGVLRSGMSGFAALRFLGIFFIVMVVPPLVFRWWAVATRRVKHWDLEDRRERVRVLVWFPVFLIVDFFLLWHVGNPMMLWLFGLFVVWFLGFFLISLFWKISGHAGSIALATGLIILWYGWNWWPALSLVFLMGWARVATKDHTVSQVVGGALYSWGLIWLWSLR